MSEVLMRERVVVEKVRRPPAQGLRRPRLTEPLTRPGSFRTSLVLAPAGCGKTTLLTHVCEDAGGPVGWYRAGTGDASEDAFVRHVGVALSPALGFDATGLADLEQLLWLLDEWPGEDALLVVDDVHELGGTPAERALGRLLDLRPPRLRVLLGTRRRPAVNLSRLRVADLLQDLDGDDLRFRSWEVERLFHKVYEEPLEPEVAAALTRRTAGWAAGLQLFHLSTAGRTTAERRGAVAALGGRTQLIRSYLADNVLDELPAARRLFLMHTCTLGLLSGPLCDELLGTSGSDSLLRELESSQLFTTSDDDGLTYRYHQVLQDHLEVLLHEELGCVEAQAWFGRSARVLERAGHVPEALRAHARAQDWTSVSQLLRRDGAQVAEPGRDSWARLLPQSLRQQDPWLALAEARCRLRQGDVAGAVDHFRNAESLLDEPGFREQCRRERGLASRWLPFAPPAPRPLDGELDPRHWTERLREATVTLRPRPGQGAARDGLDDRLALALIELLAGRLEGSVQHLARVSDQADPDSLERVAAVTALALVELLIRGRAGESLERATRAAEVARQPWLERVTRAAMEPAFQHELDDEDLRSWGKVVSACPQGDEWGPAILHLLRGAVAVRGEDGDDSGRLVEAASRFRRLHAPVLAVWADALRAVALARRGQPHAEGLAVQVEASARALAVPGARALACWVLGRVGTDGSRRGRERLAAELAAECGLPLPMASEGLDAPARHADELQVDVRLLGGFRMTVGGREVDWPGVRPRVLVLLRLLLLTGTEMHRERLVDALWPGVDAPTGTRRLQVAVSSLRQALDAAGLPGAELLRRTGESYRLSLPVGARVDVRALDQVLAESRTAMAAGDRATAGDAARRALELYDGELLPEDGPAEWVTGERDRLRVSLAEAARDLAEDCAAGEVLTGDTAATGISAARRSLELEPLQERPWQALARLHERTGDRVAAAGARRECARVTAEVAPVPPAPLPVQRSHLRGVRA